MTTTEDEIMPASQLAGGMPEAAAADPVALYKFQMEQAWEGNRDRWGKPKVRLPDSKREVGYRRASSFGSPLESTYLLDAWKARQLARGVARSRPLQLRITRAEVGLDDPNPEIRKAAKEEFEAIVKEAMDLVGSGDGASIGTSLHDILERIDHGKDPGFIPEEFRPDVEAYKRAAACFRTLSSERIVVHDKLKIGGKYDAAVEVLRPLTTFTGEVIEPGSIIIGDKKTSQSMDFAAAKFGVQCLPYAEGEPYDPITKERYGWGGYSEEDTQLRYGPGHEKPRTDWAVIVHVPSGQGIARLYWVDLRHYAQAATQADRVYYWRNSLGKKGIQPVQTFEDYVLTCQYVKTLEDLHAAYARAVNAGEWNDLLKVRFTKRRLELEASA